MPALECEGLDKSRGDRKAHKINSCSRSKGKGQREMPALECEGLDKSRGDRKAHKINSCSRSKGKKGEQQGRLLHNLDFFGLPKMRTLKKLKPICL